MTWPAFPSSGLVRAARRRSDLSQRELAQRAHVHHSTVGRIEAGSLEPSLAALRRLLDATGYLLVVVDGEGRVLLPMEDWDDLRDGAERRYPAHLDVVLDPVGVEWWADKYGLARPPETFYRDRRRRDAQRKRSQWEVRVKKYRNDPEPPIVPGFSLPPSVPDPYWPIPTRPREPEEVIEDSLSYYEVDEFREEDL